MYLFKPHSTAKTSMKTRQGNKPFGILNKIFDFSTNILHEKNMCLFKIKHYYKIKKVELRSCTSLDGASDATTYSFLQQQRQQ